MDNEYKAAGYIFSDILDYKEAKREEETIEYIKANTDLSDLNKAVKLYHKLIERKTLRTVVGFAFLKELQERIIKEGIIAKENIPCIQVEKSGSRTGGHVGAPDQEAEQRHLKAIENYKIKLRNSRIISAFLVVIIAAMILISVFSDRSVFSNYENKILNKYAAWEEDLNAREQALNQKEAADSQD